ncbi:hypothetical protein [Lentzea californiensis]|nr:hypothetical protein [Lentzea californiensis]MCR3754531.1 hypothetical protein [Lentzea californiensis]
MVFGYRGDRFPEQKVALLPVRYSDLADVTLLDRAALGEFPEASKHN